MAPLLAALVAAFLAEWGDKTQLLVIAMAARFQKAGAVLAAVALGALANSALAAFGGSLLHGFITLRAISLLLALALVFAGAAGLLRDKTPDMGSTWRVGAFLTTLGCFFLLEFGDKTQFLTLALSAQYAGQHDAPVLAAAGATVGIIAANASAALLGEGLTKAVPLRGMRMGVGLLFLAIGLFVAVSALRLV
jgi:putative Ca2+/H+ antiporter (TMEM165/GDT1 family)